MKHSKSPPRRPVKGAEGSAIRWAYLTQTESQLGKAKARAMKKRIVATLGNSMTFDDFADLAFRKTLQEMEETGGISMPWSPPATTAMNPKNAARVAEINRVCNLDHNDGIADAHIDSTFDEFLDGDGYMIYDVYDIAGPKGAAKVRDAFIRTIQRWRKEDGLPPLSRAKLAKIRKEDWSVRGKRKRHAETRRRVKAMKGGAA